MGVKVGAQTSSKSSYVRDVYAVGKFFLERIIRPWLYPDFLYLLTQDGKNFDGHVKGIHTFTKEFVVAPMILISNIHFIKKIYY